MEFYKDLKIKDSLRVGDLEASDSSSAFEVKSTSKGSRPWPEMTTAQRDAIETPASGLTIFNTETGLVNVFNGEHWHSIISLDQPTEEEDGMAPVYDHPTGGMKWAKAGGGSGSGGVNYNPNPYFTDAAMEWAVQGTSDPGTTYQIDPTNVAIHGTALPGAFILRKSATNQAARGFGYAFDLGQKSIDHGYVILKLDYTAETANLAAGDVKLTLLDPDTPANVITPIAIGSTQIDEDGLIGGVNVGTTANILAKIYLHPGQTRLFMAPTWWTSDTVAKGFVMSGLSVGPEGSQAVTYENYAEISLAGSGALTGGSLRVVRTGRTVTLTTITNPTHPSATNGISAVGLLPEWARPTEGFKQNAYTVDRLFSVSFTGEIGFYYTSALTSAGLQASISYTVSDNRSSLISTTEAMNVTPSASMLLDSAVGTDMPFTITSVTFDETGMVQGNKVIVPANGKYQLHGYTTTDNVAWTAGSIYRVQLNVNGVVRESGFLIMRAQGTATFRINIQGSRVYQFQKGDELEFRSMSSSSTTGSLTFEINKIPDLTTYGVYAVNEIVSATMTANSIASNAYPTMSGTPLNLTSGVYRVEGFSMLNRSAGSTAVTLTSAYWKSANGSSTSLAASPSVTVMGGDANVGYRDQFDTTQNWTSFQRPVQSTIIRVSGSVTVYLLPYIVHSGGTWNAVSYLSAQRLA